MRWALLLLLPLALGRKIRFRTWRNLLLYRRPSRPLPEDPGLPPGPPLLKDLLKESLQLKDLLPELPQHRKFEQRPAGAELDDVLPSSDLTKPDRKIWIVTTASLPWMTGTAVNPLLRAAHLVKMRDASKGGKVTLMLPFLDAKDQRRVFPAGMEFESEAEQELYVRKWLLDTAGMKAASEALDIRFYPARYHPAYGSIFPMGDIIQLVPDEDADICVLEEPEHLNWYRFAGPSWKAKFRHVVGVMHTNYLVYSTGEAAGRVKALLLLYINQWMCRAYCDRIVKLSSVLQDYALEKEVVCNVHGVRGDFLEIGKEVARKLPKQSAEKESPEITHESRPQRFSSVLSLNASVTILDSVMKGISRSLSVDERTLVARRPNPIAELQELMKEYQLEYETAQKAFLQVVLDKNPKLKADLEAAHAAQQAAQRRNSTLNPDAIYNLSPMHAVAVLQSGFAAIGNMSDIKPVSSSARAPGTSIPPLKYSKRRVRRALSKHLGSREAHDAVSTELDATKGNATKGRAPALLRRIRLSNAPEVFTEDLYFIGKAVWAKGHDRLMDLMAYALIEEGVVGKVTIYGSGPDRSAIEKRAQLTGMSSLLEFKDGIDHAKLRHYKAMINPSVSEVLCTTVAEALAMGKFVICADHPSNAFFTEFRNCLQFRTAEEFTRHLRYVTNNLPAPLTAEERQVLTWEAATNRFAESSKMTYRNTLKSNENVDDLLYLLQRSLFDGETGDTLRAVLGGGPVAAQTLYEAQRQTGAQLEKR